MESVTQGIFRCGCCNKPFPLFHRHVHHKIPQATGGKDTPDNLIELCPGCHDTLHKVAYKLTTKVSPTMVMDTITLIYPGDARAQKMCYQLAVYVRDAMIKTREEGLEDHHLVAVSTTLQKKHKDLLVHRCRDNQISQESYMRILILNDLRQHYPHLVKDSVTETSHVKLLKRQR